MTSTGPTDEPASIAQAASIDEPTPGMVDRAHTWVLDRWPTTVRRRIAVVAVLVAVGLVAISTLARVVGFAIDAGVLAYIGVMVVCWVGAGGALVPVPGARPLSWVMIVQQSTILAAPIVALAAAVAMALGQSSYFLATRIGERRRLEGHGHHRHGGAERSKLDDAGTLPDGATPGAKPPNRIVARSRAMLVRGQAAVTRRMATHPQRIIFALSVVPNPLTTFATVSAATVGLSFVRFLTASLAGFLVLTIALAVAGQGILVALGLS